MNTEDTISAICTGLGGAISIIRISGPESLRVAGQIWHGRAALGHANARKMLLGKISPKNNLDGEPALAVYMPGPNSYTGDNIVELHCPAELWPCAALSTPSSPPGPDWPNRVNLLSAPLSTGKWI